MIRGSGTNVFKADGETTRDHAFQVHVGPNRAWVKDLQIITILTTPQITTLQNDVDAAEAEIVALKTRATTLEGSTATQGQQIGTLTTRVDTLEANPLTGKFPQIGDTLHFVL